MLNFRSVFKCMALCLRCSSASGTSHPPQRGTVLTANLTWNCSLNERLSLFYRWSLRLNFYWLAQWHQGSWWFRERDWSPVSAVLVQMWQADYLLFDCKCWSPFRWRVTHGFAMWRGGGQEKLSESRSSPPAALSPHSSCYTMKGAMSFSSLPPSPLWNLTNHISTRNHSPFGSLHPQSLQDIDEAILRYLVAFKIYRHPWACSDSKNNLVVAAIAKESSYYLWSSVCPAVRTKLYFITRLHQPH